MTKLTLTIEPSIIEQAKKYAQEKKRSISRMVEDYLRNLTTQSNTYTITDLSSTVTDSITGMFADNKKPYNILLEEALEEKHL